MMNFEELNIETLKEGNHFEAKLAKGGIPGIVSVWSKEYGYEPEYFQTVNPERTCTVLKLKSDSLNDSLNLSDSENKVFSEIKKNNAVTIEELIKLAGISEPTVNRCLKSLKEKGVLDREGSKKTGSWKILE